MASTFISYSEKDASFTRLLVALLDYHGIDVWHSQSSLRGGERFPEGIQQALAEAETLIVLVSNNSAKSKWVAKEVVSFKTLKPRSPIVPLRLQNVAPESIVDDLQGIHWIDFAQDMLTGFTELLALFGRTFLPENIYESRERREDERRTDERRDESRRTGAERRQSMLLNLPPEKHRQTLLRRLRTGFWKIFEEDLGFGKFDDIRLDLRTRMKTIKSLSSETAKYRLRHRSGRNVDSGEALDYATSQVWEQMRDWEFRKAVYVVEGVAEELFRICDIEPLERRELDRRDAHRRKDRDRRSSGQK